MRAKLRAVCWGKALSAGRLPRRDAQTGTGEEANGAGKRECVRSEVRRARRGEWCESGGQAGQDVGSIVEGWGELQNSVEGKGKRAEMFGNQIKSTTIIRVQRCSHFCDLVV